MPITLSARPVIPGINPVSHDEKKADGLPMPGGPSLSRCDKLTLGLITAGAVSAGGIVYSATSKDEDPTKKIVAGAGGGVGILVSSLIAFEWFTSCYTRPPSSPNDPQVENKFKRMWWGIGERRMVSPLPFLPEYSPSGVEHQVCLPRDKVYNPQPLLEPTVEEPDTTFGDYILIGLGGAAVVGAIILDSPALIVGGIVAAAAGG